MEIEEIVIEKKTLESISKSIQEKRNETLDSQNFSFSDLELSDYDIRENRDTTKLIDDLIRDGQLQVITLSLNNGSYTVVNGRTRYLAMKEINEQEETLDLFSSNVKVEIYEDLTELEQNYLNAQINVSQSPLTPNEKINFVRKYKDILDSQALGKALGIKDTMLENYIEVAEQSSEVCKAFSPQNDGYGRSSVKVEELGKVIKAYKSVSGGTAPDQETAIALGEILNKSNLTRDEQRKFAVKLGKKTGEFQQNASINDKYSVKHVTKMASKEAKYNANSGGTGDALPKNSSKKYDHVDKQLKDNTYEFAVILYSEGLYRIDSKGNQLDSETKRIIDSVDDIIVVGNELMKLTEIEEYALENDKKITIHNDDVIETFGLLEDDSRNGFIYVNGASLYAQRPEFMNYLKKKFPNSNIMMLVFDLLFGKSQVCSSDRMKEIITVYGGANSFDDVLAEMKRRVKFLKLREYATTPQRKYVAYI